MDVSEYKHVCSGGGSSLYRRLLVPAQAGGTLLPVWVYTGEAAISKRLRPFKFPTGPDSFRSVKS